MPSDEEISRAVFREVPQVFVQEPWLWTAGFYCLPDNKHPVLCGQCSVVREQLWTVPWRLRAHGSIKTSSKVRGPCPRKKGHNFKVTEEEKLDREEMPRMRTKRYLGLQLNRTCGGPAHIETAVWRSRMVATMIRRVLPNIGGLKGVQWRVLAGVARSVLLYGVAIWGSRNCSMFGKDLLRRSQYPGTQRIVCGYRTISCDAAHGLAGLVLEHLAAAKSAKM